MRKPRPRPYIRPEDRPAAELSAFSRLCSEAVELHGTDWSRVARHIREALEALPRQERDRLDHVVRAVFPDGPRGRGRKH